MLLPLSCNKAVESHVQGPAETVTITASIPDPVNTRVAAGPCTWDSTALLQESGSSMAVHAISEIGRAHV